MSNTVGGAAVYDATAFNNTVYPGNFAGTGLRQALPPSEVSTLLSLGLDFTHDLGGRVHLVLSTGPSLNLFDYDYKTPGVVLINGAAFQFANPQNDESQKLRFGWVGRLGINVDLDSRKLYFAELSGEYHYIQDFDVNTNLGSATVHPAPGA